MPIARPNLPQLVDRAQTDLEGRLLDGAKALPRSTIAVLARVTAGQTHMLYGYHEWLARQPFPDTAEAEYLERHARIWGIARKAAVAATGQVSIPGTNGAVLPAGAQLQRVDGALFAVLEEATVAGGAALASVTAVEPGQAGDTPAGVSLTLTAPVTAMQSVGLVQAPGLSGGVNLEADEALRTRLLARIQAPPHGGAGQDYEAWALEVPGVTRAWVYPRHMGAGTVGVAIVADDDPDSPIPDAELVEAAQAHIDAARPVTAEVFVFAPTALSVPVSVTLSPNTTATRAAVTAELRDLFAREAAPGQVIYLSHLREAISISSGETNHVLTAPTADITPGALEFPVLGTITFN
ncbi:MAG: baseplate J/gp47 family protein [Proteobacteria bacterium]|nr:baseplate J/gp47 family protein [Pseudomonadota bacterium]MBU1594272.1 baseplate J/gp47 family protein [Pseudomonadota bacterium]